MTRSRTRSTARARGSKARDPVAAHEDQQLARLGGNVARPFEAEPARDRLRRRATLDHQDLVPLEPRQPRQVDTAARIALGERHRARDVLGQQAVDRDVVLVAAEVDRGAEAGEEQHQCGADRDQGTCHPCNVAQQSEPARPAGRN
jgi:hypothetical protein